MPPRHDTEPRPTTEVDPTMLRELLAKQRRLATGSEQVKPEPRPTVQMHRDELLGLREQCEPVDVSVVEPVVERVSEAITVVEPLPPPTKAVQPRMRRFVIGTAIACLATLWIAATGWLLATW